MWGINKQLNTCEAAIVTRQSHDGMWKSMFGLAESKICSVSSFFLQSSPAGRRCHLFSGEKPGSDFSARVFGFELDGRRLVAGVHLGRVQIAGHEFQHSAVCQLPDHPYLATHVRGLLVLVGEPKLHGSC